MKSSIPVVYSALVSIVPANVAPTTKSIVPATHEEVMRYSSIPPSIAPAPQGRPSRYSWIRVANSLSIPVVKENNIRCISNSTVLQLDPESPVHATSMVDAYESESLTHPSLMIGIAQATIELQRVEGAFEMDDQGIDYRGFENAGKYKHAAMWRYRQFVNPDDELA